MIRLESLGLERYGVFEELSIRLGPGLTVVVGPNESGKSTALSALADALWGMPLRHPLAEVVPRAQQRLAVDLADGTRLLRIGRGLFDATGVHPVDNPWGSDGDDQRSWWLTRFGLGHEALREGGRQLWDGQGDLAEVVFAARRGSGIRQLLAELDQAADALFKRHRGNRTVRVRIAMEDYRRERAALQETIVRSSDVVTAELRVEELMAERSEAVEREAQAHRSLLTLRERQRCLEHTHRLLAIRRDLGDLRALGVALDPAYLDAYDQAMVDLETAGARREKLLDTITQLTGERDALTVEQDILADGDALDDLHSQLEARLVDLERARELETDANISLDDAHQTLISLAGGSRQPLEAADYASVETLLAELSAPADLAAQLDETAIRHTDLAQTSRAQSARLAEERTILEGLAPVPALPERWDLEPLAEITGLAERDDSPLARLREATRRATELRRRRGLYLMEAGRVAAEADECPAVPSMEDVQRRIDGLEHLRREERLAAERLAQAERRMAEIGERLAEIADPDTLVTLSDVAASRAERDALWQTVQRLWLHGGTSPERPGDLAMAFERRIAEADDLADRLAGQADLAAQVTALRTDLAEAEATVETHREESGRAVSAAGDAESEWLRWWTDLGLAAPSTTRAEAVRQSLTAAATAHLQIGEAEETAAAVLPELTAITRRLRNALSQFERPQPEPAYQGRTPSAPEAIGDIELLLAAARSLLHEVDDAREARERRRSAEHAVRAAHDRVGEADAELADCLRLWKRLLAAAALPEVVDPVGWGVRAERLEAAGAAHAAALRQRQLAERLSAAWSSFAERVASVGERHQTRGEPADVVGALWRRLDSSRRNEQAHHDRQSAIATATAELDTLTRLEERAQHHLAELRDRHGLAKETDLADAAARGRQASGLRLAEEESLRRLRDALEPGHDARDMVAALADTDAAQLDIQCSIADDDLDRARERRERVARELGVAEERLRVLTREGDAASQHARSCERLAEVAELAERYAVYDLQRRILRDQLEAYAGRHASPLLGEAGRLLQRLTDGRWVALRANDDGAGHRSLEIVRGDGEPLPAHALSEGTADQVFLAMRLASIIERQTERLRRGQPTVPVVFDDALMAFDDDRVRRALDVLADAAADAPAPTQIVVFTHHAHLGALADGLGRDDVAVTRLAAPPAPSGSRDPDEIRAAVAQRRAPTARPTSEIATSRRLSDLNVAISDQGIDSSEVREWAKANNIPVAAKGRVSANIMSQYRAATGRPPR